MPVAAADLEWRYTIPSAAAGDTDAQPDPDDSLGGWISTTEIVDNIAGNGFDDGTLAENAAMDVEYRAWARVNTHATDTWIGVRVFIDSESVDPDHAIGLDPTGVVAADSGTQQGAIIATEGDAPAGVTFSTVYDFTNGLVIGDVGPGEGFVLWVRRSLVGGSAVADAFGRLRCRGTDA